MASPTRASRPQLDELLGDPKALRWTTRYLKRLLIERSRIRARLENPGGSVILLGTEDLEKSSQYSSVIGNDFHLDLLEAEQAVNDMPVGDRVALMQWVDALNPKQAADFLSVRVGSVRRRAERKANDIVETLNGPEDSGGAG